MNWGKSLLLSFGVASVAAPALAGDPSWMPRQSCKDAWAALIPKNAHNFDYKGDTYKSYSARVKRESCYKDFTVLVYMAADNDLAPYALLDLYEMEAGFASDSRLAGSTLKLDLVVQAETADSKARRLQMFQTPTAYKDGVKLNSISEIRSPVVEYVDKSAPTPDKFQKFLQWGVRKYPAKNYAVIVWGHGQGWTAGAVEAVKPNFVAPSDVKTGVGRNAVTSSNAANLPRVFGGIALDSHDGRLTIPALSQTLNRVVKDDLAGNPFALYISDACLMQMLEVANEISASSRFIVGSTQVQDFMGLPYRRILSEINNGRFSDVPDEGDTSLRIAKMIPKVFRASMTPTGLQGRHNPEGIKAITLSSISSSELRYTLVPALKDLAKAANAYLTEEPLRAIDVQYVMSAVPSFEGGAQELGAFLTLFTNAVNAEIAKNKRQKTDAQSKLLAAIDGTRTALNRTVLAHVLGTDYSAAEDKLYLLGIEAFSIWLPAGEKEYSARASDFERSEFFRQNPDWSRFLKKIFIN